MSSKSIPLTPRLEAKLASVFAPELIEAARSVLEADCGAGLPLIEAQGATGIERIRSAAVRISQGSLAELQRAVALANQDWRDVLVAGGFGSDPKAHVAWLEE